MAYVVSQDPGVETQELRRFLQNALPEYMVPAAVVLIEALPLTPNGKLDRKALPQPEMGTARTDVAYVAPRSPVEETLTQLWAAVLNLQQVGIHDNFFDLGGNSLVAMQLVSKVRQALQVELPLQDLFKAPTVAELAQRLPEVKPASPAEPQEPEIVPLARRSRRAQLSRY